jgi:hypothetical protein
MANSKVKEKKEWYPLNKRVGVKHTSTCLYSSGGGNLIASSIFGFPHFLTKASTSMQITRTASWYKQTGKSLSIDTDLFAVVAYI